MVSESQIVKASMICVCWCGDIVFKRNKKDRFKSKYLDLDFENMSDEEFNKISKKVYKSIAVRGICSILLFIVCIVALVLCGRYVW